MLGSRQVSNSSRNLDPISIRSPQGNSRVLSSSHKSFSRLGNSIITNKTVRSINEITVANYRRSPEPRETQISTVKREESIVSSPKSRSRVLSVGYGGVEQLHRELNPIYTSSTTKNKNLRPVPPPTEKIKAIFAIYTLGGGYNAFSKSYGRANGLGILLSENLCITSSTVIPDEETAIDSYAQSKDGEVYRFDPARCFVSYSKMEFTLVAFHSSATQSLRYLKPIHIRDPFNLMTDDPVFYFPFDYYNVKKALLIDKNSFTFTSGKKEELLPGSPVFNIEWSLQGMYTRFSGSINLAVRMEAILSYLDTNLESIHSPLLEHFLHQDHIGYTEKFHERFLYYFEDHGEHIWKYDIDRSEWSHVTVRNYRDITNRGTHSFNWNHRVVYLPNTSVMIIGGRTKDSGKESAEVLLFSPQKYNELARLPPMIFPRESPTCLLVNHYVYVFGGKSYDESCEKYSISSKKWVPIASMFYARSEAATCTALDTKFIFIFGGQPVNPSGKTIERYSIEFNHWELLSVVLPKPLSKHCVFPVSNRRIAILGGSASHWVFLFNIDETFEVDGTTLNSNGKPQYYIEDVGRPLDEVTESAQPCAFVRTNNKLYILNMARRGYNNVTPGVVEYAVEYLDLNVKVDYSNKPLELRANMRTPYTIHR